MKRLFTFLLAALCLTASTAQTVKNASVKITYLGYQGGHYKARIYNLQDCATIEQIKYGNKPTQFQTIASNGSYVFDMGTTLSGDLKVKASYDCGCGDIGWVILPLSVMPVTFTDQRFEYIKGKPNEINFYFTIADAHNVDRFEVELSRDNGKTYQTISIVWPDDLQINREYKVHLNFNGLKVTAEPSL